MYDQWRRCSSGTSLRLLALGFLVAAFLSLLGTCTAASLLLLLLLLLLMLLMLMRQLMLLMRMLLMRMLLMRMLLDRAPPAVTTRCRPRIHM